MCDGGKTTLLFSRGQVMRAVPFISAFLQPPPPLQQRLRPHLSYHHHPKSPNYNLTPKRESSSSPPPHYANQITGNGNKLQVTATNIARDQRQLYPEEPCYYGYYCHEQQPPAGFSNKKPEVGNPGSNSITNHHDHEENDDTDNDDDSYHQDHDAGHRDSDPKVKIFLLTPLSPKQLRNLLHHQEPKHSNHGEHIEHDYPHYRASNEQQRFYHRPRSDMLLYDYAQLKHGQIPKYGNHHHPNHRQDSKSLFGFDDANGNNYAPTMLYKNYEVRSPSKSQHNSSSSDISLMYAPSMSYGYYGVGGGGA
ncbi:sarcoplasmic reticulum histidine-rich calcium-binding protein isoform X2 [Folsomia candida]|uniref:sarcoplasmic reticulum histidine-rich calcium-binding protein isoform X2 n=1 Tax=Folsomia candida TaxID=158441 RepID=UPI001604EE5B|nr:sarcoplasmic reticulum histidine-rich calcium-binding protein isoform X2 [Folsomia candida]